MDLKWYFDMRDNQEGFGDRHPQQVFIGSSKTISTTRKGFHLVAFILSAMVLLFSVSQCSGEDVGGTSRGMKRLGKQDKVVSFSVPHIYKESSEFSSAVENAKQILGIDSKEVKRSLERSTENYKNPQELLKKIKRDFQTKILHIKDETFKDKHTKISDVFTSSNSKRSNSKSISQTHKNSEFQEEQNDEQFNSLERYVVNAVTRDSSLSDITYDEHRLENREKIEVHEPPARLSEGKPVVIKSQEQSSTVEKSKVEEEKAKKETESISPKTTQDLPERAEEYVRGAILDVKKIKTIDSSPYSEDKTSVNDSILKDEVRKINEDVEKDVKPALQDTGEG
ncbi:hypothetical protein SK128_021142 [Halocaridina rubra]|uniref:Uncharacterized protein n=1 Tax=Halocaridina rubra TaxID=373956 RepID=A0AAN9ADE5_HALRR